MRKYLLLAALCCSVPLFAQTTTTFTGTLRDLTGAAVTSGRLTFQLNAASGGVIPGTGSFVATTVSCLINATGNPVSSKDGTSPCVVTNNSALTPTGTSYTLCRQPYFVAPGSCTVTYALGGTVDISTIVPTPATQPSYGVASTAASNTWSGAQTFTGAMNATSSSFSGTVSAGSVVPGNVAQSALPAASATPGGLIVVKDLLNPSDCTSGGSAYPGATPCYSNGTSWFSVGGLPSISVPVPVRRSLFNSGLASLKAALVDEFHQYVNVNFEGDSITWGQVASGNGPITPRAHLLSDVRDLLTSNSWVNQVRNYLGRTYFGGSVTAEMGASITAQSLGSGYSGTGTCTVNGGTFTTQGTCTAVVSSGGLVFAIANPGDYTVAPTSITFTGFTGGSGASVTVGTAGNGVGHYTRQVMVATNDPHFVQNGTGCSFGTATNVQFLLGTAEDINTNGCGLQFSFYGNSFTVVYSSLNNAGAQYDLYVDGVDTGSFSATTGSVQFGVTRIHTLASLGQHTINIVNTSSGGFEVRLEALEWTRTLRVSNNGIIGTTTTDWLSSGSLLPGATQADDEFVFVSLDTNDRVDVTNAPYSTSKVKVNLGSIISYLQGLGKKVVLTQMSNTGLETSSCVQSSSGTNRFCQLDGANATAYVANLDDVDLINHYPPTSQYYNWNLPCVASAPHPGDVCHDLMFSDLISAIESSSGSNLISFGATNGAPQIYLFDTAVTSANVSIAAHSNTGIGGGGTILDYNFSSGTANLVRYSRQTASPLTLQLLNGAASPVVQLSNNASSFMTNGLCLGTATCSNAFGLTVNGITTGNVQLTLLDGGFTSSSMQMSMTSDASNDVNYFMNPTVSGGTGAAFVKLFRSTSTTGAKQVLIYKGDNSSTVMLTLDATNGGITPKQYTVATLPTCGSGNRGQQVGVTDATAPTYLGALTGGGAVITPVVCGATVWVSY